ncbi:MAG: hypothetical protein NVS3B10_07240 [Polyangiales bacterium]
MSVLRRPLAFVLASSTILVASSALAFDRDPPPGSASEPEPAPSPSVESAPRLAEPKGPPRTWYGWQGLIFDGAAVVLELGPVVASSKSDAGALIPAIAGLALYTFGAPGVHLGHGHGDRALGSLVLRVGAPFLGGALGYVLAPKSHDERTEFGGRYNFASALQGLAVGFVVGTAVASVLDATVLGYEDAPPHAPTPTHEARFVPTIVVIGGRPGLGLVGLF